MTTAAEAIDLPFEEAIAFFKQKVPVKTQHWTDVWQDAHSRAFMVAGAAQDALVEDFRQAILKAIEDGTTLAEFRQDFDQIVARHGWVHNGSPGWRAQTIYDTNLRSAYSAGRYAQQTDPDTLRVFPYWTYMHGDSVHPRPMHLAWNGTTLRADDPWWDSHYPPGGWRCSCYVVSTSRRGLARMGKSGPDTAPADDPVPWRNPRTGTVHMVPKGIQPGFGYNPGKAWLHGPLHAERLVPVHPDDATGVARPDGG